MYILTAKNGVSVINKIILSTILLMCFMGNFAYAKPTEPKEAKQYDDDMYVTTEDIISDIIFSSIDKRVMKEYPGNNAATFGWKSQRIVGIVYNNNHSYDVSMRIQVPDKNNSSFEYAEDSVKVRVTPSCDST
ncbi:hypothetical protein [Peribacillus kribbensis]|uniref:hypothetical protein n=1 Tax=Peribacillus kribbensis TaxID=356658 RepID=UPI00068641DA|nr:hypothetical protein [Peribacillus kribbensis]